VNLIATYLVGSFVGTVRGAQTLAAHVATWWANRRAQRTQS